MVHQPAQGDVDGVEAKAREFGGEGADRGVQDGRGEARGQGAADGVCGREPRRVCLGGVERRGGG